MYQECEEIKWGNSSLLGFNCTLIQLSLTAIKYYINNLLKSQI